MVTRIVNKDQMVGTWKLISFDLISEDTSGAKKVVPGKGTAPLGRITFTSENYMSAFVADSTRIKPLPSSYSNSSDQEIASVARSFMSYCGPFTLSYDNDETTLSTKVEVSLDPNWMGTDQVRKASLKQEGGKEILVLKPVQILDMPDGTKARGELSWERV